MELKGLLKVAKVVIKIVAQAHDSLYYILFIALLLYLSEHGKIKIIFFINVFLQNILKFQVIRILLYELRNFLQEYSNLFNFCI